MAESESKKTVATNYKWLLLVLLLVLLALMFLYKREDGRTYGEDTLVEMQRLTTKLIRKGGEIIRNGNVVRGCATKECKEKQAAYAAKHTADKNIVASGKPNPAEVRNAQPSTSTTPVTPTEITEESATSAQSSTAPTYPVYPAYPAYPPYADYSSYGGGQGTHDGAVAQAPRAEPFAPAMPDASQSVRPTQGGMVSSAPPPTPQANPGAPAYPAYPAYPGYPSHSGAPQASSESAKQLTEPRTAPEITKEVVKARKAVMQKRYREAQQEYRKHLAAHPDDTEAYGELGNVFLLAQQYPEAARNYYEAATRLVDGGYIGSVTPLLPIISQYEPMLATLIKQKIARLNDR